MIASIETQLAYIDPGTGSLLIQFAIGAAIGSAVFLRTHVLGTLSWIWAKVFTRRT